MEAKAKEMFIIEDDDGDDADGRRIERVIHPRCPVCDYKFDWIGKNDDGLKVVCPKCQQLLVVVY